MNLKMVKNMKSGDGAHVDGGLPMMSSSLQNYIIKKCTGEDGFLVREEVAVSGEGGVT